MSAQLILAIRHLAPYALSLLASQNIVGQLSPVITAVATKSSEAASRSLITNILVGTTLFPFRLAGNVFRGATSTFVRTKQEKVMFSVFENNGSWSIYATPEFTSYAVTVVYKGVLYIFIATVFYHLSKALVVLISNYAMGLKAQSELEDIRSLKGRAKLRFPEPG
jgi:hypothetical protein